MRRSFAGGRFGGSKRFVGMALLVVLGIAAMGAVVMLLWNWLMPALFTGAAHIDYWHGLGVLLLSKLLFGGGRFGGGRGHWHARRQHWESMTPEERVQFQEHFRSRWGNRCATSAQDAPPDAR